MLRKIWISAAVVGMVVVLGVLPLTAKAANYDGLGQFVVAWLEAQTSGQNMQIPNSSLHGRTIVIDPGHGGSDAGAIGPSNLMEKNVTLSISKELQSLLTNSGATVIMTRATDKSVAYAGASDKEELAARVAIANKANADLFVSIHADSFSGQAGGTTTYVYDAQNAEIAPLVQANMVAQLKLSDRGVQQRDYYVLKNTNMPAILTEAAFISNPREEKLLMNRSFDKKVAIGIYNGINQYFGN
ncbi:MAG: N-acetylmuramoyl-L-alanine amidase [Firmicutes bacterium]|nr:N-acetylmuramoyl-L-alanine amidase [Bacillota bacterium]